MGILPGFVLALSLALGGRYLSELIGVSWMGLPKSPISAIMMAILLGVLIRNTIGLSASFQPGVRFGLVRVLRAGIVLLGIRLGLGQVGEIGLQSLPVIIGCVGAALLIVTYFGRKLGLSGRLGTLIAVGTSICGATAIVATAPAIGAHDDEVAYSIACIPLFGVVAMLVYPFAAHWMFAGDPFASGLFLGTAVHETAQVAGAGLVTVTLSGKGTLRKIHIDRSVVDADDVALLEDLVTAAFNDAKTKMDAMVAEKMSEITGGLQLPPGMKLPF